MAARGRHRAVAVAAGTLTLLAAGGGVAAAAPVITPAPDAETIARAILGDETTYAGAAFTTRPTMSAGGDAPTAATFTADGAAPFLGFPLAGAQAGLLSSGDTAQILGAQEDQPDADWIDADSVHTTRGESVNDATTLRIDVTVPAGSTCLALSYRFLSEEFPEFVGSRYNDAFVAELDNSTWTTDAANDLQVPDDFATKAGGKPVSVNGVGPTSVTAGEAVGTVFDAATGLVTTKTPVTPGAHSVYLSIFDQSDHIYDSAVMLDRLAFINEPATTCKPPEVAVIVPPPPAPPAPPAPGPAPPPANDISVPGGSVTFRNGSATVTIQVPGPGTVTAAQAPAAGASRVAAAAARKKGKKLVKPARKVATKAGPLKLKLKLTKAGKKALKRKHTLKVRLAISFTPTGGTTHTELKRLKIKLPRKHKH